MDSVEQPNELTAEQKQELENQALFESAYIETQYNGEQISWRYWMGDLPMLSAAQSARLMCGLDPLLFEELDARSTKDDLTKLFRKVRMLEQLAVAQGKATDSPQGWLQWAMLHKFSVHPSFRIEANAVSAQKAVEPTAPVQTFAEPSEEGSPVPDTNPLVAFLAMENLRADELTITFVGDKSEIGLASNAMLEINARNVTRKVGAIELELTDRRTGRIKDSGALMIGMAEKKSLSAASEQKTVQKVARLRKNLRSKFGLVGDPIPFVNGVGWQPSFQVFDKRGALDERARVEAERRTSSLEELEERGHQFGEGVERDFPESINGTDEWMKNNGHSWN